MNSYVLFADLMVQVNSTIRFNSIQINSIGPLLAMGLLRAQRRCLRLPYSAEAPVRARSGSIELNLTESSNWLEPSSQQIIHNNTYMYMYMFIYIYIVCWFIQKENIYTYIHILVNVCIVMYHLLIWWST